MSVYDLQHDELPKSDMHAVLARHAHSGGPVREVTIACLEERMEQLGVETGE